MKVDYIIVGSGLAGLCFCEQLIKHQKSFVVFDDASQTSSIVAAGVYNPVVLKRFTAVWKSKEQLDLLDDFYGTIENRLGIKLNFKIPVYRKFKSLAEQNNWFVAADNDNLKEFLSDKIKKSTEDTINAPFGLGKVNGTGRIDLNSLIVNYHNELEKDKRFVKDTFDYKAIDISEEKVLYGDIEAEHIVFAEGFGVRKNPFFKSLPLSPTKGELLIIDAPYLQLNYILKSAVFIVPIGEDKYIVGSTYNWEDFTNKPTEEAKKFLIEKLEDMITVPFRIVNHLTGIRPTVKGRKPLVGTHPIHKNVHILNGLGTRGVMIGPYVSKQLYNAIEYNELLDGEININRFF